MSTEAEADTSPPLLGVCVLITGAAGETGRDVARALSLMGANLHLADTNETALVEAVRAFRDDARGGIKLHISDVAERVDVEVLAMDCEDADILVHLSGDLAAADNDDLESDEAATRAWKQRVLGGKMLASGMDPDVTDKDRCLLVFPLFPDDGGLHPRMANAALGALAQALSESMPAVTAMAAAFESAEAIAENIRAWVLGETGKSG